MSAVDYISPSKRHTGSVPETIGVLIPTYRRPADLLRCLDGLQMQEKFPDDVMVIVRNEDTGTRNAIAHYDRGGLPLRILMVEKAGTVHAHNVGIDACTTDVLAMIDDDTVPHAHWLRTILEDFQADPRLGGLGGRDRCFDGRVFDESKEPTVGRLQWFGRAIGNHHRGYGAMREVDLLKGANMSFRHAALETARCDVRLRGRGAQPNEDISLTLAVKRAGWKIAYDPNALVDHYQAIREEKRHYGGVGPITDSVPFIDFAYNEVIGVWDSLSLVRKIAFVIWSVLIGTGVCPGVVQAIRFTPRLGWQSWYRFGLAQKGKLAAVVDLLGSTQPTTASD
ncbi:MAG TPA: glycosyltransferase [Terracidiphilus sp.]|jgi:cellulose synthase/poly-beta-1,6-N-acetylglucosamine synthase-like glycosyltransferase|nr:glycosyltransferase [Terracidiphilus sp.]